MKIKEDIEKIVYLVTGNLDAGERKEVLTWIEEDPAAKKEFHNIKNAWAMASAGKPMSEYRLEELYKRFSQQRVKKNVSARFSIGNFLRYAAVFALAMGISAMFFYRVYTNHTNPAGDIRYTTVMAGDGHISKVVLPDSSIVWLNSGTKITYNNNFAVDNREISLAGQAFLQVTKNKEIPLKVLCNNLEVRVLGTRFDVSAYPGDKTISVVLESGQVEMRNTRIRSGVQLLKPGEMARYTISSGSVSVKKIDPGTISSWKDGVLMFRDEPMSEVLLKLKRRYNIDIEVRQPQIYGSVFTATIQNQTLEEIFRSIAFSCSLHYKIVRVNNQNIKTKVILSTEQN